MTEVQSAQKEFQARARFVRDMADVWQEGMEGTRLASASQEMLRQCSALLHAQSRLREAVRGLHAAGLPPVADAIISWWAPTLRDVVSRLEFLVQVARAYRALEDETFLLELDQLVAELRDSLTSLERGWPWPDEPEPDFDPEVIRRTREAHARGELVDLGEMLRELQGQGPARD